MNAVRDHDGCLEDHELYPEIILGKEGCDILDRYILLQSQIDSISIFWRCPQSDVDLFGCNDHPPPSLESASGFTSVFRTAQANRRRASAASTTVGTPSAIPAPHVSRFMAVGCCRPLNPAQCPCRRSVRLRISVEPARRHASIIIIISGFAALHDAARISALSSPSCLKRPAKTAATSGRAEHVGQLFQPMPGNT
jgi:hypothetical protein